MRIGILSDTHLYNASMLPHQVEEVFSDLDLILHAGDIYDPSVLDRLERIAPVLAAKGGSPHPRRRFRARRARHPCRGAMVSR